jgi:hypothetical protein
VSVEPYVRYPRRLLAARQRGELTFDQYSLACYLCGAADYRTGTYVGTVGQLADGLGWESHHRTLRRDLEALKGGLWIDYEVQKRQRQPYVIRLTGLLVLDALAGPEMAAATRTREHTENDSEDSTRTPQLGHVSKTKDPMSQSHGGETVQPERHCGDAVPEPVPDAPSTSTALRRGEDDLGREDQGEPVTFEKDSLDPEVREAVERAERARREHEFVRLLMEQFPGSELREISP